MYDEKKHNREYYLKNRKKLLAQAKNTKCEHGNRRATCLECKSLGTGGNSICEHNRQKWECLSCKGERVCEHSRPRRRCKVCGGFPALAYAMWKSAKDRSRKENIPFTITVEEVFTLLGNGRCPILGIPYNLNAKHAGDDSASLDKFYPSIGYTRENCTVISNKANRIKSNASVDEVQQVAYWMHERGHLWRIEEY